MASDAGPVVLFDGVCNLCTRGVAFILAHERDQAIRFAAMQSAAGRALLHGWGIDPDTMTTVVFVKNGAAYRRSDAALEIARHLRWPWRMLRLLRFVPRRLRDALYDAVARRRYRWFGRRETCPAPTADRRARFLDA